MRAPAYPAPVPLDPDVEPQAATIGNQVAVCRPCGLVHEIPTSGQIVAVRCTCGRTAWRRPGRAPSHNDPTITLDPACAYGHTWARAWCRGCKEVGR